MKPFFNQSAEETLAQFNVTTDSGLSLSEAQRILKEKGPNQLVSKKQKSLTIIFLSQFKSSMVLILIIAAIVSAFIGIKEGEGITEAVIILAILFVNAIIGTWQEKKAQSSLEALNRMSSPHSKVLRDGSVYEVVSTEIVPGDIVVLDTGDIIPADMRLIEAFNLKIQESALTGESVPVEKNTETITSSKIPLGDHHNMAFSTSIVTYGRGKGVVVGTGMDTEVGKIAHMLQSTQQTETPMSKRLEQLGKALGYVALAICLLIFGVGILYGNNWLEMFMIAVSLAVAAIPEGLQIVSTIVLAFGVQRLVKLNAIVRTLPSVETLGSTTVICSDKTGTLTQNKMTVVEGWTNGNILDFRNTNFPKELRNNEKALINSILLCTDAHLKIDADGEHQTTGDPTETAIIDIALDLQINKNDLERKYPRVAEIPFDSDRKRMATINMIGNGKLQVNVKGGLDEVLNVTTHILKHGNVQPITNEDISIVRKENERMAKSALRVLSVAYKEVENVPAELSAETVENSLIFVGLIGMIDPARPEVIEAINKCETAGIKPVMITGDHKVTAVAIAQEIGIYKEGDKSITGVMLQEMSDEELRRDVEKCSVYARVAPEHKVRIVRAWQSHGNIVAMTGDGVNDAPALKQADIGVAMGVVGTEVAKDAADVVLTDDNFATIVDAVEEGRRIYDNILKAIQFLLSANVGEVLLIFVASIFNIGNPLTPIMILWVNLVTDSLPALALSMDPAEKDIMTRRPRNPKQGFFTKGMTWRIFYQGITIGLISLFAYFVGYHDGGQQLGQTMAFSVLAFSQLIHVRNLHSNKLSSFRTSIFSNSMLLFAILASTALMLAVLFIPPFRTAFSLAVMDTTHWLYVIVLSFVPILIVEITKLLKINYFKNEY
ncbi:MAG: calcium-translocating P-type ATPase, PMCA-type [Salinivirgaceae bacterium]|jgi:Ca2+-transporting ATPase|nr:calcium-translocating P-type ATPase, PMCA-type [Bacteroidales bacterium]